MGRYSAPSPFGQGGTSDLRKIGVGYSDWKPDAFGPKEWSRRAARRAVRLAGQGVMAPCRLIELLSRMNWSVPYTAQFFAVAPKIVRSWRNGHSDIPQPVADLLESIVASSEFLKWEEEQNATKD